MQIPKIAHFGRVTVFNLVCGAWPFFFKKNIFIYTCYRIYAWIFLSICFLYAISTYIDLVIGFLNTLDLKLSARSVVTSTIYMIGLIRVLATKSKKIENLILEIFLKEQQIFKSGDKEIIDIYNENVRKNAKLNRHFWVLQMLDSATYVFIYPVFSKPVPYFNPITNESILEKPLPLHPWFPFDEHNYHTVALLWSQIGCFMCMVCNCSTDVLFFSLITYVMGQIDILKHFLKKFDDYSKMVKNQLDCDKDKADFVTMQLCVMEHQRLLNYVINYNNALRDVMLMDFVQSSIQLALILVYIINETFFFARIISGLYSVIMLTRLAIYYWYGNEIIQKSYKIGDVLFEIGWYEKSTKLKSLMVIFILRCNKQTALQIGSLTVMTMNIFFRIIKGAYSFMAFTMQR